MKRVALYCRVSTTDQTCDNQLRDLRDYCRARGWEQVTEYVDQGISGTRERRPALDGMMAEVKARRVDVVVVAAFDRFVVTLMSSSSVCASRSTRARRWARQCSRSSPPSPSLSAA